jgi:hypothetical protein
MRRTCNSEPSNVIGGVIIETTKILFLRPIKFNQYTSLINAFDRAGRLEQCLQKHDANSSEIGYVIPDVSSMFFYGKFDFLVEN